MINLNYRSILLALVLSGAPRLAAAEDHAAAEDGAVDRSGVILSFEAGLGTGLALEPSHGGPEAHGDTRVARAPVTLRLGPALAFADDPSIEWVLGLSVPLEHGPGFGAMPGVRIGRPMGPVLGFVEGGPAALLVPTARFGLATRAGVVWEFLGEPWLGLVGALDLGAYFPPGNSEERGMTLDVQVSLGLRVLP